MESNVQLLFIHFDIVFIHSGLLFIHFDIVWFIHFDTVFIDGGASWSSYMELVGAVTPTSTNLIWHWIYFVIKIVILTLKISFHFQQQIILTKKMKII